MPFVPIRKYNGNQVILTSDRLIFNAKEDNIFMSTKKDIAISAGGSMHINVGPSKGGNSSNIYLLNAPKIQFGLGQAQPVPKGNDLSNMIEALLKALNSLAVSLSSATGIGVGAVNEPSINAAGIQLQGAIQNVETLAKHINSKVTFTT